MKKILFYLIIASVIVSCQQNDCSVTVTLKTGEVISAQYVRDYVSGFSNIKKCDGTDLQIYTNDIEVVKEN